MEKLCVVCGTFVALSVAKCPTCENDHPDIFVEVSSPTIQQLRKRGDLTRHQQMTGVRGYVAQFAHWSGLDRTFFLKTCLRKSGEAVRYQKVFQDIAYAAFRNTKGSDFSRYLCLERGDVIYGCWEARMAYTVLFASRSQQIAINRQRYLKTDTYNDTTWRFTRLGGKAQTIFRNTAGEWTSREQRLKMVGENLFQHQEVISGRDAERSRDYYIALEGHRKYSPETIVQSRDDPGMRRKLRKESKGGAPTQQDLAYDKQTRRACKFGIEYAVTMGRAVHFILDGLFLDETSLTNYFLKKYAATERTPITMSELLFVCRHWDEKIYRRRVLFYCGGRYVAPPWISQPRSIIASYYRNRKALRTRMEQWVMMERLWQAILREERRREQGFMKARL